MFLSSTNQKLEVFTDAAPVTANPVYNISYNDYISASTQGVRYGDAVCGALNGTTPIQVLKSPPVTSTREIVFMTIYNADSVSRTITVQKDVDGVKFIIVKVAIASGDTLEYSVEHGWGLSNQFGGSITGIASLNGLTPTAQYFVVGTAGSDFAINSLADTHTFNIPTASATKRGLLSSADWTTFNSKEPAIPLSSSGYYWRGDKTWQLLNKAAVGLGNVDNTSDINKPISTATQTALNAKQDTITLTTTGSSGPATLVGATLNIPQYSSTGGGIKSGTATQVTPGVYTSTITGVASYATGDAYLIKFDTDNDGASTIDINSLGAKNIYKNTVVPIASGDIGANQEILIVYDGTNFQAIGLSQTQVIAYVHNAEGAVINKGQVVYAYQAAGNKMSVKLARADVDATSAKTIGMVYDSSIGIGGDGHIIIQGVIEGINTASFSAGDTLYLSGTTFGGVTNVKPYAPTHLVYVGIVERANAGAGQVYVRCQNGYELDEIHDVDLITVAPVNGDSLVFNGSLWVAGSRVSGSGTTNELAYFTGSKSIGSLSTATYPSLTELSYVKGVTSSIQTQLGGKQGTLTLTTTGTSGPSTLVGSTLNIPQYSGGGGVSVNDAIAYAIALG